MAAVWMRSRAELRGSWRAWLVLALLIGLAGGVGVAAAAGARRTATAYPRLVAWSHTADVETGQIPEGIDPVEGMNRIVRLPSVIAWTRVDVVSEGFVLPDGRLLTNPQLLGISDLQGRFLTTIGRAKVVGGRMYDPKTPNEAVVDFALAERMGLQVGETLRAAIGDPFAANRRTAPVRIVGIIAHPRVFPSFGANNSVSTVELSPAFAPAHGIEPDPSLAALQLRLRGGASGVPAFMAQVRRAGLGDMDQPYVQAVRAAGVQRSTRIEAGALWALAALVAIAAGAVLGQALSRQTVSSSVDFAALRAVGVSRGQLFGVGMLRAAAAGATGAVVAVALAFALSPLTPIGLARVAEPNPGFAVDVLALAVGALCVAAFTLAITAVPAWRAARRAAAAWGLDRPGSSALATAAARSVHSPVAAVGVRMAIDPRRGREPVPIRAAILGATLAIVTLISAITFWSSLRHLVDTPRLSGLAWDVFASPPADPEGRPLPGGVAGVEAALRADPNVARFERGAIVALRVGRTTVEAVMSSEVRAESPVVVAGRAPAAPNEISLAAATMRSAGVAVGDSVVVATPEGLTPYRRASMQVVGEIIAPSSLFGESNPGEGAAITLEGGRRLAPQTLSRDVVEGLPYFIRFRDGVEPQAAFDRLQANLPDGTYSIPSERRGDIVTLGRITRVPLALALLLGIIAVGTLAQTLVTSVRARRGDLAILKTLGFSRRQVRGTVAWQATTLISVALVLGVPLGIAAGRWTWRLFAEGIAVVPAPVLNPALVALAVPAAILFANLIAAIPAQSAARTRPAVVLRSE